MPAGSREKLLGLLTELGRIRRWEKLSLYGVNCWGSGITGVTAEVEGNPSGSLYPVLPLGQSFDQLKHRSQQSWLLQEAGEEGL